MLERHSATPQFFLQRHERGEGKGSMGVTKDGAVGDNERWLWLSWMGRGTTTIAVRCLGWTRTLQ